MKYLKILFMTSLLLSSFVSANWINSQGNMIMSESIFQKTKTGGAGEAMFFLKKGSLVYITKSDGVSEICRRYPDAVDNTPIIVEGVNTPATSWCAEGNMFTSIDGDAGRWVFELLWKHKSVTIDGWKVNTSGFQQAVKNSQN